MRYSTNSRQLLSNFYLAKHESLQAKMKFALMTLFCLLLADCLPTSFAKVDAASAQQAADQVKNTEVESTDKGKEPPVNLKPIENVANAWLRRPELQHSQVGLEIMHIPSGQVIFSSNGHKRFTPASTTKVYTTACAMDSLGPSYTFSTKLKAYGTIEGSKLVGALVIEPSEDPTLETADLRELLTGLQRKGIKSIEGKVLVASIPGGGDRFCSGWLLEDWGQDWMPVPSDLVVDGNLARTDPARGYPMVQYSVGPDQNALVTSVLNSIDGPSWVCFHPASKTMQYWHPSGPAVGGQIVGNPGEYNLAIVESLLKSMGIKVKDKAVQAETMQEAPVLLADHHSDPLSVIIKYCLKESDNLYAQQLLRTLGNLPSVSKSVEKASLEDRGLARINQWLLAMGVAPGEVLLWDGCGLSRKDCFTPHALNMVHRHMAGALLKSAYLDVLPLNGAEGATTGTFRYKTGTMDSVRCISGVLITGAGEPLAVTVMVNSHNPSIRDVRASMGGMIGGLQSLGSLRLPTVPVSQAIPARRGAAAAGPVRHSGGQRHRRHRR